MSDNEDISNFAPYTTDYWDSYEDAYEDLAIQRAVERSLAAGRDNQGLNPERPSSALPHFHPLLTVS
jgi:hypothetical protein